MSRGIHDLLISWPSCYGQHETTNSAINWSRFSGSGLWDVLTPLHSRHCVETRETKVGHKIKKKTLFKFNNALIISKQQITYVQQLNNIYMSKRRHSIWQEQYLCFSLLQKKLIYRKHSMHATALGRGTQNFGVLPDSKAVSDFLLGIPVRNRRHIENGLWDVIVWRPLTINECLLMGMTPANLCTKSKDHPGPEAIFFYCWHYGPI